MYSTSTQILLTPDQLADLVRGVVRSELADYIPPVPAPVLPEYLTRKQTAQTLQVSLATLHSWAKDTPERPAILVPQKVATRVRYKRDEVLLVLKENRRFRAEPEPMAASHPAKAAGSRSPTRTRSSRVR